MLFPPSWAPQAASASVRQRHMLRTRVRIGLASGLVISVLFAALLTVASGFELFFPRFAPVYGQATALALRVPYASRIVRQDEERAYRITFEHRRILLPPETVLSPADERHRAALNYDHMRRPPSPPRLVAAFMLYLFSAGLLLSYFARFGHGRLQLVRSQVGVFAMLLAVVLGAKALLLLTAWPAFWLPLSAATMWVTLGFDRRAALIFHVAASFLVASLLRFDLMWLTVFVARGLTATLLFRNRKQPRQMLLAAGFGGLLAALAYYALIVMFESSAAAVADITLAATSQVTACVGGGLLAGVLGYLLREPAALLLGHVSRSRLLDLTDIEEPLLRKMATEAPGSWEHSRAMANLAEAAAASIGANSLLTRVGAYYHDLGKTIQCKYFIENLSPGERSPHDDLAPEVSADAIMAHVVMGTKILRDGGVPEPVVEFAYTHHGTQRVEYFWNKYRQAERDPDETVLPESHFRYPGMKPMNKETAILMLVDSVEAASRTIQPPDKEKFEQMIQRIVFSKLNSGQLDDSGLTLVDLRIMTSRMADALVNMYHGRIKYPWQRKQEEEERQRAEREQAQRHGAEQPSQEAEVAASGAEQVEVSQDSAKHASSGDDPDPAGPSA